MSRLDYRSFSNRSQVIPQSTVKFARPTAHGVSGHAPWSFFRMFNRFSFIIAAAPRTPRPQSDHFGDPLGTTRRPWAPLAPIFVDFQPPRHRSKNQRFFDPSKNDPKSSKYRPFAPQGFIFGGFLTIFGDLFEVIF